MYLVYHDEETIKIIEYETIDYKSNYILIDGKYLLGVNKGWVHKSQIKEITNIKPILQ